MKLAGFKRKLAIILANIKFTYQIETAFRVNNWANVLSTCFYTLSMILFINVMYSNVKLIAGYSKDEMLFFMLIGQLGYYLNWTIHSNLVELIPEVNKGKLDTLLVRPVPSLFYVTFKKIRIFSIIRDCVPPQVVLALAINWRNLDIIPGNLMTGLVIVFLGMICIHIFHLLATLPVFWLGESDSILNFSQEFEYYIGESIPYEGYNKEYRLFFTTLVPVMIKASVATSVILGKTPPLPALLITVIVTICFLFVRQWAWNKALRRYTSASS